MIPTSSPASLLSSVFLYFLFLLLALFLSFPFLYRALSLFLFLVPSSLLLRPLFSLPFFSSLLYPFCLSIKIVVVVVL